jgi:hypothetical protein
VTYFLAWNKKKRCDFNSKAQKRTPLADPGPFKALTPFVTTHHFKRKLIVEKEQKDLSALVCADDSKFGFPT